MKKLCGFIFLACALSGCAAYSLSEEGGRLTADIENSGWLFCKAVPLFSGDPAAPNRGAFRLFENTVTLENNMKILTSAMHDAGAYRFKNLTSHYTEESIFILLFTHKVYHTSAELEKDPSLMKAAADKQ